MVGECHALLHHRGEASGLALADDVNKAYAALDEQQKLLFFQALRQEFAVVWLMHTVKRTHKIDSLA